MGIEFISITALLLLEFSPTLNVLLQLGLSRSMEFQAEYDAASLTGDPLGLASALHNIDTNSKPWLRAINPLKYKSSEWLSSHPETAKRIGKLHAMVEQYPVDESRRVYNRNYPSVFLSIKPSFWILDSVKNCI